MSENNTTDKTTSRTTRTFNAAKRVIGKSLITPKMMLSDQLIGGSIGDRLRFWGANSMSTNSAISENGYMVRMRAWNLYRNNAYARRGVDALVDSIMGDSGPTLRFTTPDKAFNESAEKLFKMWSKDCDIRGARDLNTLIGIALRETLIGGDSFTRMIQLRANAKGMGLSSVPLSLNVYSSDYVPYNWNTPNNGARVYMGVEFGNYEEITAYWMLTQNPREYYSVSTSIGKFIPTRIQSSDVLQILSCDDSDQVRGKSVLACAMPTLIELDEFEASTLLAKKNQSTIAGVITRSDEYTNTPFESNSNAVREDDFINGDKTQNSDSGNTEEVGILDIEPGTNIVLNPGQDYKAPPVSDVGSGYSAFVKSQLCKFAASIGVSYEMVSGDYSSINDRILRGINIETQKTVTRWRRYVLIPYLLRPLANRFIFVAAKSGALQLPKGMNISDISCEWTFPGFKQMNSGQEIQYYATAVRNGFMSRKEACSMLGTNSADVDYENALEFERADSLNIIYDTDVRKVNLQGAFQLGTPNTLAQIQQQEEIDSVVDSNITDPEDDE